MNSVCVQCRRTQTQGLEQQAAGAEAKGVHRWVDMHDVISTDRGEAACTCL